MRGGPKIKRRPNNGQKALLTALWHRYGGIGEVSQKLGMHLQAPLNWRCRGKVPLTHCYKVAEVLKLPKLGIWGLNYIGMSKFYTDNIPDWSEVVKSFRFAPGIEEFILSFPAPTIGV